MEIRKNPEVNGVCDVACLELGEDTVTQQTGTNCLHRIGKNPIIYENYFPLREQELLSQSQLEYVEDIIVTRETVNLGVSRREAIQTLSDIGQSSSYVQE